MDGLLKRGLFKLILKGIVNCVGFAMVGEELTYARLLEIIGNFKEKKLKLVYLHFV